MAFFNKKQKFVFFAAISIVWVGLTTSLFIAGYTTSKDSQYAQKLFRFAAKEKAPYSQSKAHMSLRRIQEKITKSVTGLAKNKKIITQALQNEGKLKDNYYVFYTAVPAFHLLQDVTKKLYQTSFGKVGELNNKSFHFIRYEPGSKIYDQYKDVTDFLVNEIKKNGIVNDRESQNRTILVSTNLALFGNAGFTGESTWYFFNEVQPWAKEEGFKDLKRKLLASSLESFGYTDKYVDKLMELEKYLMIKGFPASDLFQIFIPKKMVDRVGYLSWRMGIPFDERFIKKLFNRKKMTFGVGDAIPYSPDKDPNPKPGKQYLEPTVYGFTDKWKKREPQAVSMVNSLIENIKRGKFHLSPFLKRYTNNPGTIGLINWAQGRLLITNSMLLNPGSGIKIFRYNRLGIKSRNIYKAKLNAIIKEMVAKKEMAAKKVGFMSSLSNLTTSLGQLQKSLENIR